MRNNVFQAQIYVNIHGFFKVSKCMHVCFSRHSLVIKLLNNACSNFTCLQHLTALESQVCQCSTYDIMSGIAFPECQKRKRILTSLLKLVLPFSLSMRSDYRERVRELI